MNGAYQLYVLAVLQGWGWHTCSVKAIQSLLNYSTLLLAIPK